MLQSDHEKIRIVIIGGGVSGIASARTLHAAGFRPTVLEARERLGGRIFPVQIRSNFKDAHSADENYITVQFGANWIHGLNDKVNPMFHFAKTMGLLLHPTSSDDEPGDDVLLFNLDPSDASSNTQVVSLQDYAAVLRRYEWVKANFDEVAKNSPGKNLREVFEAAILASDTFFGPRSDLHNQCLQWLLDRVAIDMGSSLEHVDKATYIEGDSEGMYGEALVVHGGYYRIFDALASEYPLDVRFRKVVQRIDWGHAPRSFSVSEPEPEHSTAEADSKAPVTIHCSDGEVIECDVCIVTIPLGVLSDVEFLPRPPACISSLMQTLRPSLMNLVWLWYPSQFWPVGYNFLGVTQSASAAQKKFTTFLAPPILDKFGQLQPVLMCQVVGEYAEILETLTDAEIAEEATSLLRQMFRDVEVPDPVGCGHSSWKSDPYSKGSWSLYPFMGDSSTDQDEDSASDLTSVESLSGVQGRDCEFLMGRQCKCIFYAGEATAVDHRGTVHGAFKSGIQQANNVINYLKSEYV